MQRIPSSQVTITHYFWGRYQKLVSETVLPYQYEILSDNVPGVEKSHAIQNFRIAAKEADGEFGGLVFQDSDLAKWLEAVGHSLAHHPDAGLEAKADAVIDLIAKAQQPDGYVNTYFILNGLEKRFTNLTECHELYCLGHMLEAALAYYGSTGKRKLLDVMIKYVDLAGSLFGPEDGKIKGYPGHEVLEMALCKLYDATGDRRHLDLAMYFLDERGKQPSFFLDEWGKRGGASHWGGSAKLDLAYYQAHKPVREQDAATGHAVRAVYLYTGMAMAAARTGDESLMDACRKLWGDIVNKQMYITGGIGQTHVGEAFTFAYDLPNDTAYAETCASIGLIFFARAMLDVEAKSEYADVIERALFNTVLAGMGEDGKHFFYVNPLEAWPEASEKSPIRKHALASRPEWYPCACCPPNVSRLLASLGGYIYGQDGGTVFVHLYIGGEASFQVNGKGVHARMVSDIPAKGACEFYVDGNGDGEWTIAFRIPWWSEEPEIEVNLAPVRLSGENVRDGYLYITRDWREGDMVHLGFPMHLIINRANVNVRANAGKIAFTYGPTVLCAEGVDNGENLSALVVDTKAVMSVHSWARVPGVIARGRREKNTGGGLYADKKEIVSEPCNIELAPYYAWGNRGVSEMAVWLRYE